MVSFPGFFLDLYVLLVMGVNLFQRFHNLNHSRSKLVANVPNVSKITSFANLLYLSLGSCSTWRQCFLQRRWLLTVPRDSDAWTKV